MQLARKLLSKTQYRVISRSIAEYLVQAWDVRNSCKHNGAVPPLPSAPEGHHHHHHHVTQSSHSINAIGPAPLWSGRKRKKTQYLMFLNLIAVQSGCGMCMITTEMVTSGCLCTPAASVPTAMHHTFEQQHSQSQ
jgi:hypothetical protein